MIWFDTHAHLQDEDFAQDLSEVLLRAEEAEIGRILLPGANLAESAKAVVLAGRYPQLCCAVGVHPHDAVTVDAALLESLRQLARNHPDDVVAIGEIGLDYHYDLSPRDRQQKAFRQQLELAFELGLPLIIHEREAHADCLAILREAATDGLLRPVPGVFHCFSGSPESASILLDMGFYLGFDGPITFKNARKAPDVIRMCPLDRLVLETDSPYLSPEPFRGRRNEPARIPLIGTRMAEIRGEDPAVIAAATYANACRLFSLS